MSQTRRPEMIPKSLNVKDLQDRLLAWFRAHARVLPWRQTRDPYAIWLSETMLQQTQVSTVTPYYIRFLQRFPTVEKLAAAELSEVLSMWAGLGYYRRAKHLHAAAQKIVADFAGKVPATSAQLLTLPGVGSYTAAAVASIAFGEPIGVLDGNVIRVLSRFLALRSDLSQAKNREKLQKAANFLTSEVHPGRQNEAFMELGATICTPTKPLCPDCPLRAHCRAHAQGIQEELPNKKKPKEIPTLNRVAIVISRSPKGPREVLMMQRPLGGTWEQMWEFPVFEVDPAAWAMLEASGKKSSISVSPPEIPAKGKQPALNWRAHFADVLQERLGISVELERWLGSQSHQLTHRTMNYRVLRGHVGKTSGGVDPKLPQCEGGRYVAFRWVRWPNGGRVASQTGTSAEPMGRITFKIAALAGMMEPESDRTR